MDRAVERKARRRIRRQLETGQKQARVRKLSGDVYGYVVKHHGEVVKFRIGKTKVREKIRLVLVK